MLAKSFPPKQVPNTNFHQTLLVGNSWLQNHFLENRFLPKFSLTISGQKLLVEKSFPRKHVPTKKKLSSKYFGR